MRHHKYRYTSLCDQQAVARSTKLNLCHRVSSDQPLSNNIREYSTERINIYSTIYQT